MSSLVASGVDGNVGFIRLNRASARNALNFAMCGEIKQAVEMLGHDRDARVVVFSADGPVFCAGADLKERVGKDEAWVMRRREAAFAAYDGIARCPKPIFAVIDGPVVGSGGELIMSCDFAIASPAASFRFPEPHWGTVGATQRLQRAIGKSRAKELLLTGRTMSAEEAFQRGLLARLVPAGDLAATAAEIAATIASAPPLAMALTKQTVDFGSEATLANGIRFELAAIERCLSDEAWKQGVARFADTVGASGKETAS